MSADWMSSAQDWVLLLLGLISLGGFVGGVATAVLRWQIRSILMKPNGGNSIADVSSKVDDLAAELRAIGDRVTRVEHQVDQVIIPRQADIWRDRRNG